MDNLTINFGPYGRGIFAEKMWMMLKMWITPPNAYIPRNDFHKENRTAGWG